MNSERESKPERQLAETSWNNLLGPQTALTLTATPVCNGIRLRELGQEMSNCLVTMLEDCRTGSAQVFRLNSADGQLAAAGELRLEDDRWRTGQVEGPERGVPPPGYQQAMQEIARRYNAAARTSEPQPA